MNLFYFHFAQTGIFKGSFFIYTFLSNSIKKTIILSTDISVKLFPLLRNTWCIKKVLEPQPNVNTCSKAVLHIPQKTKLI
jgi:hypothetical protein